LSVQLFSKIFNLCCPDPTTSQTDTWTDGHKAIAVERYIASSGKIVYKKAELSRR